MSSAPVLTGVARIRPKTKSLSAAVTFFYSFDRTHGNPAFLRFASSNDFPPLTVQSHAALKANAYLTLTDQDRSSIKHISIQSLPSSSFSIIAADEVQFISGDRIVLLKPDLSPGTDSSQLALDLYAALSRFSSDGQALTPANPSPFHSIAIGSSGVLSPSQQQSFNVALSHRVVAGDVPYFGLSASPIDHSSAKLFYEEELAVRANPDAAYSLARLLRRSSGVFSHTTSGSRASNSCPPAALALYRKAMACAVNGLHPPSAHKLAMHLLAFSEDKENLGSGGGDSSAEALSLLQKCAAASYPPSQVALAKIALHDDDFDRAVQLLKSASDRGSAEATNELGVLHFHGRPPSTPPNAPLALDCFSSASSRGLPAATCNLALFHELGLGGLQRDVPTALLLYSKAASATMQGGESADETLPCVQAIEGAGRLGLHCAMVDFAFGTKVTMQSTPHSNFSSSAPTTWTGGGASNSATIPSSSNSSSSSSSSSHPDRLRAFTTSLYYLRLASDLGSAAASYELGLAYDRGIVGWSGVIVPEDPVAALSHLRHAVERCIKQSTSQRGVPQGNQWPLGEAAFRVGEMLYEGKGLPNKAAKDYAKSLHYYQISASCGNVSAMNAVGIMLEEGRGCANGPDEIAAMGMFCQGMLRGDRPASGYCAYNLAKLMEAAMGDGERMVQRTPMMDEVDAARNARVAKSKATSMRVQLSGLLSLKSGIKRDDLVFVKGLFVKSAELGCAKGLVAADRLETEIARVKEVKAAMESLEMLSSPASQEARVSVIGSGVFKPLPASPPAKESRVAEKETDLAAAQAEILALEERMRELKARLGVDNAALYYPRREKTEHSSASLSMLGSEPDNKEEVESEVGASVDKTSQHQEQLATPQLGQLTPKPSIASAEAASNSEGPSILSAISKKSNKMSPALASSEGGSVAGRTASSSVGSVKSGNNMLKGIYYESPKRQETRSIASSLELASPKSTRAEVDDEEYHALQAKRRADAEALQKEMSLSPLKKFDEAGAKEREAAEDTPASSPARDTAVGRGRVVEGGEEKTVYPKTPIPRREEQQQEFSGDDDDGEDASRGSRSPSGPAVLSGEDDWDEIKIGVAESSSGSSSNDDRRRGGRGGRDVRGRDGRDRIDREWDAEDRGARESDRRGGAGGGRGYNNRSNYRDRDGEFGSSGHDDGYDNDENNDSSSGATNSSGSGNSVSSSEWFYKDKKGQSQGPWSAAEINNWVTKGWLPMDLLVKEGKDGPDASFVKLQDVWNTSFGGVDKSVARNLTRNDISFAGAASPIGKSDDSYDD